MKEKFFEVTKLSLIQRNFFFDRISKKCFFDSKKLFSQCKVYSHPLMCPLLWPKVLGKKIHYCGKILGETDFINLFNCTGWSMALNLLKSN